NAQADEIALVPNTTAGIGFVAEGLPWQPGENVVIAANEFPSNQYPWLNLASRGVEVRRVAPRGTAIEPADVAAACDDRTRIVALSWVGYATGWRIDPAEMAAVAHARGALFLLDAIQGLGVFPLDVQATGVDFFAADGHKWMLGPEGAGLLFVRADRLELLRPVGVGWNSVVAAHDFAHIEARWRPAASRYEGGSQNMVGFHGLGASLDLLAELGLGPSDSPLADAVLDAAAHAADRLRGIGAEIHSPTDDAHRSGIVAFSFPQRDPQALRAACLEKQVALACRDGRLRISPHAYNNTDDVDRLMEALSQ
ncbi:MAG: aminotransferase class V-fold PLP-dependent enzyme, partial [Planctomycetales bacterium]|nr:aminotransferase class V-fold PLP-dependent enzyme [Planctomycetales bacterium]